MVAGACTLHSLFDSLQTVLKIYLHLLDSDLMLICRIALTRRDASMQMDGETVKKRENEFLGPERNLLLHLHSCPSLLQHGYTAVFPPLSYPTKYD